MDILEIIHHKNTSSLTVMVFHSLFVDNNFRRYYGGEFMSVTLTNPKVIPDLSTFFFLQKLVNNFV